MSVLTLISQAGEKVNSLQWHSIAFNDYIMKDCMNLEGKSLKGSQYHTAYGKYWLNLFLEYNELRRFGFKKMGKKRHVKSGFQQSQLQLNYFVWGVESVIGSIWNCVTFSIESNFSSLRIFVQWNFRPNRRLFCNL